MYQNDKYKMHHSDKYISANRIIKVFDKPTFFLLGLEIEILPIDDWVRTPWWKVSSYL